MTHWPQDPELGQEPSSADLDAAATFDLTLGRDDLSLQGLASQASSHMFDVGVRGGGRPHLPPVSPGPALLQHQCRLGKLLVLVQPNQLENLIAHRHLLPLPCTHLAPAGHLQPSAYSPARAATTCTAPTADPTAGPTAGG